MSAPPTPAGDTASPAESPALAGWGITVTTTGIARWRPRLRRAVVAALTSVALSVAILLSLAGVTMASTSPARADIFGVSDAVQAWLCGIVSPSEPWEGVGDGPESWMSNRNLAGIKPAPVKYAAVGPTSATITTSPASLTAPTEMNQIKSLPTGNYTLYEVAGLRGLTWWTIPMDIDGTANCDLWPYLWTQAADLIFTGNKILLQVTIAIKEAASGEDPLAFLYDASGGVMSSVFTYFFIPIAAIMLMLAGLWVGIQSMRGKNGLRSALGAVGAALAITALAAFLYSVVSSGKDGFRQVAKVSDQVTSEINAVAANAVFDGLTGNSDECSLPKDNLSFIRGQRLTSCVLADALGYRPWAIGQFGAAGADPIPLPVGWTALTPDANGKIDLKQLQGRHEIPCYVNFEDCSDLRTYLIAQHGGVELNGNLDGHSGFLLCAQNANTTIQISTMPDWVANIFVIGGSTAANPSITIDRSAVCSPMFRVFVALATQRPDVARAYAGDVGIARVSQAMSALIGTIVAAVAVLITSLISMGWEATTFVLYLSGPIRLGFAVYAGKAKLAKAWFHDLIFAWLARIAYGLVLTLTILVIVWMFSATMSFGLRLVWLGIILMTFWKGVQKVQEHIRPGAASLSTDIAGGAQRAAGQAARRSTRVVTGGASAGAATFQRRRALASDPTRGALRRTAGNVLSPLSILGGAVTGAVRGPQAAQRRAQATVDRTVSRQLAGRRPPSKPRTQGPGGHPAGAGNTQPSPSSNQVPGTAPKAAKKPDAAAPGTAVDVSPRRPTSAQLNARGRARYERAKGIGSRMAVLEDARNLDDEGRRRLAGRQEWQRREAAEQAARKSLPTASHTGDQQPAYVGAPAWSEVDDQTQMLDVRPRTRPAPTASRPNGAPPTKAPAPAASSSPRTSVVPIAALRASSPRRPAPDTDSDTRTATAPPPRTNPPDVPDRRQPEDR